MFLDEQTLLRIMAAMKQFSGGLRRRRWKAREYRALQGLRHARTAALCLEASGVRRSPPLSSRRAGKAMSTYPATPGTAILTAPSPAMRIAIAIDHSQGQGQTYSYESAATWRSQLRTIPCMK